MLLGEIVLNKHLKFARGSYLYEIVRLIQNKSSTQTKSLYNVIKQKGLSIIGEIRKASPEFGLINNTYNFENMMVDFSSSADAVSVHTEEKFYQGKDINIEKAHALTDKPIIMRDYIISPLQIFTAKKLGASAVFLMSQILNDAELKEYFRIIKGLYMDAVIEVSNKQELDRAIQLKFKIISINTLDYKTLEENTDLILAMRKCIPPDVLVLVECSSYDKEIMEVIKKAQVDGIFAAVDLFNRNNLVARLEEIRQSYQCLAIA